MFAYCLRIRSPAEREIVDQQMLSGGNICAVELPCIPKLHGGAGEIVLLLEQNRKIVAGRLCPGIALDDLLELPPRGIRPIEMKQGERKIVVSRKRVRFLPESGREIALRFRKASELVLADAAPYQRIC